MEKGRLIVSTKKSQGKRLTLVGVCSGILIAMGVLCIVCSDVFEEVFGSKLVAYVIGIVMVAYPLYQFLVIWFGQRSYVDVYEHCIEGITALGGKGNMEQFQVRYSDIRNVNVSKYRMSIYTQYATYEVVAMVNCNEAASEIRKRISSPAIAK